MKKILFITSGNSVDYLNDLVFHGLYTLPDLEVVDSNRLWYLYKDADLRLTYNMWGHGFTVCRNLDDKDIDRSDLELKINDHYFDYIIYGSIQRCKDYWDLVSKSYNKNEIIFCDGEDNRLIDTRFNDKGIYFKRELLTQDALPISFAIPREKIDNTQNLNKTKFLSNLIPGDSKTYIYTTEESYYKEYQSSIFAKTRAKAGWDCLRHYEIIANKCLPMFDQYEFCPKLTMVNWPTELQLQSNKLVFNFDKNQYIDLLSKFIDYMKNNLTTEVLAKYILSYLR